jgi:hypothetical protein
MLAMVLGLLVSGCGDIAAKKDKFQLIASSDGKIYRIDKENGKVSVIENEELKEIKEGRQALKVGEFYTTEDGKVVKYIGSTSQKVWKQKSDGTWAQDGEEQKYIGRYPRAEPVALFKIIQASLDLNPDVLATSHTQ